MDIALRKAKAEALAVAEVHLREGAVAYPLGLV